jgi:hypothetical protein
MKLCVLTLDAHRLIIVISFWCISPFINKGLLSLSCFINVGLKSALSEISIATPDSLHSGVIVLISLFPAFHPKPGLVSVDEKGLL